MFGFKMPRQDGDNAPDPRELLRIREKMLEESKAMSKNKLYVYHKPNTMLGHNYSDDVAVTYATSRAEAFMKFKKSYDCGISDIEEVWFNSDGVAILTDY